jgi:hypothetical protein
MPLKVRVKRITHSAGRLSLPLFVLLGAGANDVDPAMTADDLAILAHFFNGRTNFHGVGFPDEDVLKN